MDDRHAGPCVCVCACVCVCDLMGLVDQAGYTLAYVGALFSEAAWSEVSGVTGSTDVIIIFVLIFYCPRTFFFICVSNTSSLVILLPVPSFCLCPFCPLFVVYSSDSLALALAPLSLPFAFAFALVGKELALVPGG